MLIKPDELRRLCRANELLRTDGDPRRSIEDVARTVAMSPFHFTRRFAAVFGATPHQVRIAARLERARELLARGHHSVTDVCLEVGFSSLGSFSALFARRVGEAPSAYRRRRQVQVLVPAIPGCLGLMAALPRAAFEKRAPRGAGTVAR